MPYWIAGALLVVVLLAALIVWQACALSRCRFWCPSCGRLFRLPWTKLLFRRHVHEDWLLRCLHCGEKGWCAVRRAYKGGR